MHRDIFRLQLANNRHLIENFPPPFFLTLKKILLSDIMDLRHPLLLSKTQY